MFQLPNFTGRVALGCTVYAALRHVARRLEIDFVHPDVVLPAVVKIELVLINKLFRVEIVVPVFVDHLPVLILAGQDIAEEPLIANRCYTPTRRLLS